MVLTIPGLDSNPTPKKRAAIEPPSVTASSESLVPTEIPTNKPVSLQQGGIDTYTAIDLTGTTAPNNINLAIPELESSQSPEKRKAVKPPSVTASPEAVAPTTIPTHKHASLQQDGISIALALPEPTAAPRSNAIQDEPVPWIEETVASGDSLSRIFSRLGLSAKLLHQITNSSKEAKGLTRIKPGESLKIRLDNSGRLQKLIYQRSPVEALHITPEGDDFKAKTSTKQVETRQGYLSGTIISSFYLSAQKAGLSDALIMDLATIFGWDIDFALEIRKGDRFSVVFEEEFLQGNRYGNGRILAAEFVNRGKVYRAIRHKKDNGEFDYHAPDGKSMRKAFLRAPVDFRRISSRFSKERFHPVLGKKRPHRGVDYAAATGTPIKAAGNGRVIFRGTKGGYGRTVILKHGKKYTTLYAHMSKFHRAVKNGSRVRQGQTIGYVGKSGLATGPHLHYEFRVNNRHRNPLTVKLPASAPIAQRYRKAFLENSRHLTSTLDLLTRTMLAQTTTK
ncbi:MAG: peptidoglycan DD-metalloendopeptidase family protein [Gammaproteobacteria bacterium]|nr:peptidoglycan DD-metalloendopeptidase family protein [Gammaproteobacteria bacterium]